MNQIKRYLLGSVAILSLLLLTAGCTEEMNKEHYYTFTGEMLTDYLENRSDNFSEFITVLQRAEIYDLLSTYGKLTCFAPTNNAIDVFLNQRGLSSVDELTDADCDTLAYSHLIKATYFTTDLNDGVIPSTNMLDRYLSITSDTGANSAMEYYINKASRIVLRDDSVENGVVHVIDKVLSTSNDLLPDMLEKDSTISLFYSALVATGLDDLLRDYIDRTYFCGKDSIDDGVYYHTGQEWETAYFPKDRKFKYTAFIEPDHVYQSKGITNLTELIAYAKQVYDRTYPQDAGQYDNDLKHRKNPLNRFVAYHLLDRMGNYNELTITGEVKLRMHNSAYLDAMDYYETLCPHTVLQVGAPAEGLFINRKGVGSNYTIRGVKINAPSESSVDQSAVNGVYHYIDDILVYDVETRDQVFNVRFRMDATTLSADFMNSGARGRAGTATCTGFKKGSVKGWDFTSETLVSVRNRHINFDSYQGDEVVLLGKYDFTFKLPPVPAGTYEIRLGYCAMATRGIIQIFFDKKPVGIPLDLRVRATDESIGWVADTGNPEQDKAVDKAMRNRGYMKGPDSIIRYTNTNNVFRNQAQTFRRILTTQYLSDHENHYVRIKQILDNDKAEFAFDYIELCPKSVYASEQGEDTH
ncbi:MAG: fasciclin domain-containing protein [Bacteroidales bacterium]|jgi:uncharacterized surface protein with fasciclin (FAS1) repeats|nr:fasciclin domain-containing protein [Bacteroidales bacterium]OPZ98140.1 MAG: Fasciclin domain protein [Bacteroidetes bacterium ADurb.Bin416]HBL71399.1 hypothetical protein [Bacteroidales bacterium]